MKQINIQHDDFHGEWNYSINPHGWNYLSYFVTAPKYQPRLEKRHEQLKSVYDVTPVWLNSVTRIEAFLFLYFVALLVQSIIERAVRQSMEKNGLESIPIYPESRECRSPTTDRILGLFENVHYHDLIRNGTIIQTFQPRLNEIQLLVLKLLDIPVEVFRKFDFWTLWKIEDKTFEMCGK